MVLRRSMASDTNIKKPKKRLMKRRERRSYMRRPAMFSRLGRVILLSNLAGLLVLVAGSMAMSRFSKGLIAAKIDNLTSQTELITAIMGDTATGLGLAAELDVQSARSVLSRVKLPDDWRVRLHDKAGQLIADSAQLDSGISISQLDPIIDEQIELPWTERVWNTAEGTVHNTLHNLPWRVSRREALRQDLTTDIRKALLGERVAGERYDGNDDLIVSISLPVKRVQQVLGVVTLESSDVDNIVDGERRALTPIIGLALLTALLSSLALMLFIGGPIRRLARGAELVSRSSKHRDAIPDLSKRKDEIGDLSIVMRQMASGLYSRVDDVANFAGDVAHEIKNPLTSLRSASDSLRNAKTQEQRDQLIDIVQNDVARMDRLITDISKASKVDANLARETAEIINVSDILTHLTEFYQQTRSGDGPEVVFQRSGTDQVFYIRAFETPFAQVLRNLIDNALTFSPPDGSVRLTVQLEGEGGMRQYVRIMVEDDGPGIPPDNLETIFDRFYTQRPDGAKFGSHSGLGLAICRQIMTAHRGTIRAENQHNEAGDITGARFILDLPLQTHGNPASARKTKAKNSN